MNPPALVIRLALEADPVVYLDTLSDTEERRLIDWLTVARPSYGELAARVMELAQEAKAA
jgi:hypothetical protein